MDSPPPVSSRAAALTTHAKLERLSEPWALNRVLAIAVTFGLAILFGSWAASGEIVNLILVAVWLAAGFIIVFVQDCWWAPPLVISALSFETNALGFAMNGMEIGVIILALTLPTKMAMKTLSKAEPRMDPGIFYWLLLGYVLVHAGVILGYNKIGSVPLKNIAKAYYTAVTPLIFFGLLIRYCHTRTVRPTLIALFFTTLLAVAAATVVHAIGASFDPFGDLPISVGWLNHDGAEAILRVSAPYLFIAGIAFWPTVRSFSGKVVLCLGTFAGAIGAIESAGRLTVAECIIAGIFFAFVRRKLWLALPVLFVTISISFIISSEPDLLFGLPESIQRSLAPLNFSNQKTEIQEGLVGSDDWHASLRSRSLDYWTEDPNSFFFGHGYKSWDPAMTAVTESGHITEVDSERIAELAIEMGLTENMFSSITNIFGLVGFLLYVCFMFRLAWTLFNACRVSPERSDARALCEFSLIMILTSILFCPVAGSVPGLNLVYWSLGLLAARPYIGLKEAPAGLPVPERPAFARPAYSTRTSTGSLTAPRRFRPGRA